jgi:hypothetical protein
MVTSPGDRPRDAAAGCGAVVLSVEAADRVPPKVTALSVNLGAADQHETGQGLGERVQRAAVGQRDG